MEKVEEETYQFWEEMERRGWEEERGLIQCEVRGEVMSRWIGDRMVEEGASLETVHICLEEGNRLEYGRKL
jgi:hypothetical protein